MSLWNTYIPYPKNDRVPVISTDTEGNTYVSYLVWGPKNLDGENNDIISSPEAYGAVGNGLTDDTTAIQTCINNNRNVMFGAGKTYRITASLTVPSNSVINLNNATLLTNDGSTVATFLNGDGTFVSSCGQIFDLSSVSNIMIINGKIAQCISGINCYQANNIRLDNLEIYWCGDGIITYSCNRHELTNLYLHDNRRTCLSLTSIDTCKYDHIKIYNHGIWAIYIYTSDHSTFTNVNIEYDTTYQTFYGGATAGVMNVAYLNKQESPYSWAYAYGQKTVEYTAYLFDIVNTVFTDCEWSHSGLITRFVNLSQNEFNHCEFNLYWTMPDTNGTGIYETLQQKLICCTISGLLLETYTPDGAEWDLQLIGCDISGQISTHNMNSGTGVFKDSRLWFDGCRFTCPNNAWELNQFEGEIKCDNCDFYSSTSSPQYCLKFYFDGTQLQDQATIRLNGCRFRNPDVSYYPLIFENSQILAYSPFIYVNNCQFVNVNGKAISNTRSNVFCLNMDFEDNFNTNTGGTFTFSSCVYSDLSILRYPQLTSTNWWEISTLSTSDLLNLTARSPTDNLQILDINQGTIVDNRDNYDATNSPRFLIAGHITAPTMLLDYVDAHPRSSFPLVSGDEVYQTLTPATTFYLASIGTLESTIGSYMWSFYSGAGTSGTLLASGSSTGGTQDIAVFEHVVPITAGQTYTIWFQTADNSTILRTTSGAYGSNVFFKNGADQPPIDWALYGYGAVAVDMYHIYAKGLQNTEIITSFFGQLNVPFTDAGSGTWPSDVTEAMVIYDSNSLTSQMIRDRVQITDTTQSVSTSTGSVVVDGGVAVGNGLNVEGRTTVNGNAYFYSDTANTSSTSAPIFGGSGDNGSYRFYDNTSSFNMTMGWDPVNSWWAMQGSQPTFDKADLYLNPVYDNSYGRVFLGRAIVDDVLQVDNIAEKTPSNGVGIESGSKLVINDTTDATALGAGAVQIGGGLGVDKSMYIHETLRIGVSDGDKIVLTTIGGDGSKIAHNSGWELGYYTGQSAQNQGGSHQFYTSSYLGYDNSLSIDATTVSINNTTQSTSTSTGALITAGGAAISKNLSVGGALNTYGLGALYYRAYDNYQATTLTTTTATGKILACGTTTTLNLTTPSYGGQTTYYALRIMGWIRPLYTEVYTFYLSSTDDSAVLYINHQFVVKSTNDSQSGTISLTANQWVPIYLEWINGSGAAHLQVLWSSVSQTIEDLPNSQMAYHQLDNAPSALGTSLVNGILTVIATDTSTSTSTGSITTVGGVGVGQDISVGETVKIDQITEYTTNNGVEIASGSQLKVHDTTDSGFSFSGAFQVDGGASIAKQLYVGGATNFAGAVNIIGSINNNKTIVGLDVSHTTFIASYQESLNADYARGSTSLIASVGSFSVTNQRLVLGSGTGNYVRYSATDNATFINQGTIRFHLRPNYSGAPTDTSFMINVGTIGSYNNALYMYHEATTGALKMAAYDSVGDIIFNSSVGIWTPTTGTEYEFEWDIDVSNGETRVFIEGNKFGVTQTATGIRTATATTIQVGDWIVLGGGGANFGMRDLIIYDNVQHTVDFSPANYIPNFTFQSATTSYGLNATGPVNFKSLSVNGGQELIFMAKYVSSIDADYGLGNTAAATVVGASISGGKLVIAGGTGNYVRYVAAGNADFTNTGAIRWRLTPAYSGTPTATVGLIGIGQTGSTWNQIYLYHASSDGIITMLSYDSTGVAIHINIQFSGTAWVPVAGTEYEFLLNLDLTLGQTRLFIDGIQYGTTLTQTGTRGSTAGVFQLGGYVYSPTEDDANFAIRDVMVYNSVQETADYVPGYSTESIYTSHLSGPIRVTGATIITNTTESTSTASGSIHSLGGLAIEKNLYVGGEIHGVSTTNSTSTTAGSQIVSGGVGIGGNLNVGGTTSLITTTPNQLTVGYDNTNKVTFDVSSGGDLSIDASGNDVNFTNTDVVHINNTVASTSTSTGALVISGGIAIDSNITINEWIDHEQQTGDSYYRNKKSDADDLYYRTYYNSTSDALTVERGANVTNENLRINLTTNSSSTSTGGVVVTGGAAVAKTLRVGESIYVTSGLQAATLEATSTATDSTSTSTGAILSAGGLGVAKQIHIGGVAHMESTVDSTSTSTGAHVVTGGLGVGGQLHVDGVATMESTLESTSLTTGSSVVIGGLGVGKNLYVGGDVHLVSTTDSTSVTTGAEVISGGLGIAKQIHIGGVANMDSTIDSTSTTTGAAVILGGLAVAKQSHLGGIAHMDSTLDSTSTSTGAQVITGGLGVGQQLHVAGIADMQATVDSISLATGAQVMTGGLGVTKNVNVGGNLVDIQSTILGGANTAVTFIASYQHYMSNTVYGINLNADYGLGDTRYVFIVGATNTTGYLLLPGTGNFIRYSAIGNADFATIGTIKFKLSPDYSGVPSSVSSGLINIGTVGSLVNLIWLYHDVTGGHLRLRVYNSSGTVIINSVSFGVWTPTGATEYEFELDMDLTGGATRLFINGIQFGSTITSTGTRTSAVTVLQMGDYIGDGGGNNGSNYKMRELVIFNTVQHTADYQAGYSLQNPVTTYGTTNLNGTLNLTGQSVMTAGKSNTSSLVDVFGDTTGNGNFMSTDINQQYVLGSGWDPTNNWWTLQSVEPGISVRDISINPSHNGDTGRVVMGRLHVTNDIKNYGTVYTNSVAEYTLNNGVEIASGNKLLVNDTTDSGALGTGSFQISGGASITKQLYVGGTSTLTGPNSISGLFTIDSSLVDHQTMVGLDASHTTFIATYNDSINADYGRGSLVPTATNGSVALTNGRLVLGAGTDNYIRYSAVDNATFTNQGTIRLKYTPNYASMPGSDTVIFNLAVSTGNSANSIWLYHKASNGHLVISIKNSSDGSIMADVSLGYWAWKQYQEYEFELDVDISNGATRLFIDGTQFGATQTATGIRTATVTLIQIGSWIFSGDRYSNFSIRDFQIFDTVQHTTDYTTNYTLQDALTTYGLNAYGPTNLDSLTVQGQQEVTFMASYASTTTADYGLGSTAVTASAGSVVIGVTGTANTSFIATYKSTLTGDYGLGTLAPTASAGSVSITNGKLVLGTSTGNYVRYAAAGNADFTQTGAIKFKITPNYTTSFANNTVFVNIGTVGSDAANAIWLFHAAGDKTIRLRIKDSSNANILSDVSLGVWTHVQYQEYIFELNIDITTGATRLFIDGTQQGTTQTATGTRTATAPTLQIGDWIVNSGSNLSDFSMRDLAIFNTVQHTANYTADYVLQNLNTNALVFSGGTTTGNYVRYAAAGNADLTQIGTIRFKITPNYSGTPSTSLGIISIGNASTLPNLFVLRHVDTSGILNMAFWNSSGVSIFESTSVWSPISGTEYEFSLNFDFTAGATRLFIDGTQFGSLQTQTGTRTSTASFVQIGDYIYGTPYLSNFSIRDLIIYNTVQHTADYTPGYSTESIYTTHINGPTKIADSAYLGNATTPLGSFRWGTSGTIGISGSEAITFSPAFPTSCDSVIITANSAATANSYVWTVGNVSNTGFTIYSRAAVAAAVSWFAIGGT
jgi:hypothetical protein